MKSIWKSKIVWLNVVLMVIEVAAFFETMMVSVALLPLLVAIQGVGNIILRVWFTDTAITLKTEPEA